MDAFEDCEPPSTTPHNAMEHVPERLIIPGDSPAYYLGDTSNDVLAIEALTLAPNQPRIHFILELRGEINESIGKEPQMYITVYLNGRFGPTATNTLSPGRTKMKIVQNGRSLPNGEVPTKGKVTMSYENIIPYTELRKGLYTVRVEMYASKEVGKARLTGFEGATWIDGGKGDGCGGW